MENKKIVFITSRLPFPADSGRKNVMYNYCKILHEKYNMNVSVISFADIEYKPCDKPNFIEEVYIIKKINKMTKIKNIIKYCFFSNRFPLQVCLYYDEKSKKYVKSLLEKEKPDIVISDMVRMAEYLKLYDKAYKISNLDDLISIRYKRQLNVNMDLVNPYGNFLASLPEKFHKLLLNKYIKKYVLKKEIKLLEKYEVEINNFSDKTVFVAQGEADIYNQKVKENKAISIPLGVDIDYFSEYNSKIDKEENTICFLGNMGVTHNEAGVRYFVKEILPIILSKNKNVKFYIVGGGANENLKILKSDNIIFTGRVEDVREYVGKCQVFICPLIFGSGIKTKNLEAMAMKLPIVTTSIGAENIYAKNGEEWYVCNDKQDFANKILKLLKDKNNRDEIANKAYNFVNNNFTWKVAEKKIGELLEEIKSVKNE